MSQQPIPFVIASTPRSGTAYMAQLLSKLGVACRHETYFDRDRQTYFMDAPEGCVSWLSVPFLANLPKETLILHQVRNPVQTINSLIETHNYLKSLGPNMPFLRQHCPPLGRVPEVHFWQEWHKRIEDFAIFRYRVEEIPIEKILQLLNRSRTVQEIDDAKKTVTLDFNSYGPVSTHVKWDELPLSVKALATKYGYCPSKVL